MSDTTAFTIFDTETTGLDPLKGHKIIEIAGVRIENGIIMEEQTFESMVNPERSLSPEAMQVNHITEEDVCGAQTIDQVLPAFLDFATGSTLVAHNADFDMRFLESEKECCWGYISLPPCICTMRLSRALYPNEFRHTLDAMVHRFNLTPSEHRHRALPDVILTAQSLVNMIEQHALTPEKMMKLAGMAAIAA